MRHALPFPHPEDGDVRSPMILIQRGSLLFFMVTFFKKVSPVLKCSEGFEVQFGSLRSHLEGGGSGRREALVVQSEDQELQRRLEARGVLLDPLAQLAEQQDAGLAHRDVGPIGRDGEDRFHHFRDVLVFFSVNKIS